MTYEPRDIARQLAGFVATELGDGWTVDTSTSPDHVGGHIDGPNGARLFIRLDWRDTNRVEIHGTYPAGARDVYPGPESHVIGVRRDRGPDVIAREIRRRLLPGYLSELERIAAAIDRNGRAADAREAFARELAGILPGYNGAPADAGPYPGRESGHVRAWIAGTYFDLQVNHDGTGASVDRSGILPAELWRELAAVMADYTRRTGATS